MNAMADPGTASFTRRLDALAEQLQTLPDKPEETAASTLRALWHLAAGRPLSVAAAEEAPLPVLDAAAESRLQALVEKRLAGVPLAHLSGRQRFMGLEMRVGPEALIPRLETELLARTALALLLDAAMPGTPRVLDICTGCGNLALALAHHAPQAKVHAADLSADAVALAGLNAAQLGLAGRVDWRSGDLLAPFDEPTFHHEIDLLVCNPPYISSKKVESMSDEISLHEPRLAFDGGALGIGVLNRLVREAPRFLKPGGWLAVEVGLGQATAVAKRLQSGGRYARVAVVPDAHGEGRVVTAQCTGADGSVA